MKRPIPHGSDPIFNVLKMAQYAFHLAIQERRRDCAKENLPFRDDETSYKVYVPMDDEKKGYTVFIVAEYHYGAKKERFHGVPPPGSLIFGKEPPPLRLLPPLATTAGRLGCNRGINGSSNKATSPRHSFVPEGQMAE